MTPRIRTLAVVATLPLLLACGGGDAGPSQPAGSTKVTLTEFKFDPNNFTVTHGKVVFFLVNSGSAAHDMVILDSSGGSVAKSELVQPGNSSAFTVDNLAAGHYQVVCDVPGHKESGMTATLDVS